jgi:hypothetical protein
LRFTRTTPAAAPCFVRDTVGAAFVRLTFVSETGGSDAGLRFV